MSWANSSACASTASLPPPNAPPPPPPPPPLPPPPPASTLLPSIAIVAAFIVVAIIAGWLVAKFYRGAASARARRCFCLSSLCPALADGRALQPVLTFPDRDGNWCREFLLRDGDQDWRGVACREAGRWETQVVARETFLAAEEAYRPAGAGDNDKVAGFITRNAADIALGASDEQALITSGWQDAR